MKVFVIFLVLMFVFLIIPTSLAQQVPNCTFGGTVTPMSEKFAKDLAVKEFLKQNPNATKSIPTDDSGNPKNQFILSTDHDSVKETLELHFHIDDKGCYIPAEYHYKYNDEVIDVIIINTIGNFTEIMNLIKSDSKTIDDFYPKGCSLVDLEHNVSNGKIYGICKQGTSITVLADMHSDGEFTVDIPIEMVYSLPSSDCIPTGDFIVIGNRGSPKYEIVPSDIGNLVKVQPDEGFHRIRIAGSMIIPSPAPGQYCGIVEGYDKPYMPPLDQIKHDMKPSQIRCNDDLVLVYKYDDSPACVNYDTIPKLIQRGWVDADHILESERNIPKFLCEQYGGGFFDGTSECIDLGSKRKCTMLGGVWGDRKCIVPELVGMGIEAEPVPNPIPEPESDSKPEPERTTDSEIKLREAKDALENAYFNTVNVGNFYIKDVIVGFGTYDNTLVIDIPSEYIGTHSMDAIKQDIRHIVGNDVPIDYVLYDESIARFIPTVMPYLWNQVLNQKGIEYVPKNQTYWNHADGFADHDKVCSPVVASNGTELYIWTTFDLKPFQITETGVDKNKPTDCHKTWKTDAIMTEPDRVTALWLKNQMVENEN